jgi:Putative metal-binding motif
MTRKDLSMATRLLAIVAAFVAVASSARAEPASCLSPNPADWPAPSKPYFMVIADTSSSTTTPVAVGNSCGYPNTLNGHLRCALKNAFSAFAGSASFGLTTFPIGQTSCSGACFSNCIYSSFPGDGGGGCGASSGATRRGGNVIVPLVQDNFWTTPSNPSNASLAMSWVDNSCSGNTELFSSGLTPLNGALRDMFRYYAGTYTSPDTGTPLATPIASAAVGERACRSVNVIAIADGETCDTVTDAVNAAAALFAGVTVGGQTFNVRTYVVNYGGGNAADMNSIAAAGGTTQAFTAGNENELTAALRSIVTSSLHPETCDNLDNNCNGCTDEGSLHYCDVGQTCCVWSTTVQRTTCLTNYKASITPGNPRGNAALLPCTTAAQAQTPATWLCYDPGDACDNLDNNCSGVVDESQKKCGSPLHCPSTEVCNGQDDNCNGVIDDGACSAGLQCVNGACVP